MESKSVAEKMMVVGPTEDVVHALMEKLVFPCLSRISMPTPTFDQHKAIATQMHAVVLLYNYYHRKHKPDLKFLDLASFCNLAVVLKPSLAPFMKVTQRTKLLDLNVAESQFSVTEKEIKNACDIAAALDASLEVPIIQAWPISKVAVLLIDSSKENCKLQFGAVTEGVWSLFEKEVDGLPIDPEKPSGVTAGDKRKRDNLEALTAGNEILQLCYNVVREITGTDSNELVVLGSGITYSLKEEKSATQFYLIQLPGSGTISPKEQVPLKFLVEKLEGPLAEKAFGTWSSTEVVNYYHMLPYVGFISGWLSGKDLCSPSIHDGFAQSTLKSCSNEHNQSRIPNSPVFTNTIRCSEHTDNDSLGKTTKSSDETGKKCKRSSDRDGSVAVHEIQPRTVHIDKNANQRRDTTKKYSRSVIYLEKLVQDMNERENDKNLVKDDDVVLKKSTRPRLSPVFSVKEAVNDDQHKVFQSKGCSPLNVVAEIGDTKKLHNNYDIITVFAPKNEEERSNSPNILFSDKKEIEDCQNEGYVFCSSPNSEGLQSVTDLCDTYLPNSGQGTTISKKLSSRAGIYYHRKQHNLSPSTQIDNNHDPHDDATWNGECLDSSQFKLLVYCFRKSTPASSKLLNTAVKVVEICDRHYWYVSLKDVSQHPTPVIAGEGFAHGVESVHSLKNSKNTGCRNGNVSGEREVAISSDQIQNGFSAVTNKSADHGQLCPIEGTTKPTSIVALENELASSEELQNALALLCTKREKLFSQICSMEDTLALYEDCIERIQDGGEVGLARRCIESIISGNNHWMLKNETTMQDKDHKSKSQTGKQSSSRLSGIFAPSKCQYLEYMCLKNNWRLPRYLVEPAEGKFRSNVVVVSKDFKVASKGGLETSPSEARESAASQMIVKICYETEESID